MVLSSRLQKVIGKIVNPQQTAYIKNRFIGNSCRLTMDIYEYAEKYNKDGAIVMLDFLKAFDSIEWNFMFEAFKRFNFDENFIKWLKILYVEPVISIKQNGWLTENIKMYRSCRQGCPISAQAFIICTEILSLKLNQNQEIHGINIGNNEYKMSQFADDTNLFVSDKESIDNAIKTIKTYSRVSGLELNMEKTEGIWLGNFKDSEEKYAKIKFTKKPVKSLGIYFGHDKEQCYKLNWTERIEKLEKILDCWKKRHLTLFGKITVIKSLALHKLIYVASILPYDDLIIKTVNNLIFKFLWDGKKDKIRRTIIINKIENGGLNMIDFECQMKALKAAWIPRLYEKNNMFNKIPYFFFDKLASNLDIVLKMNDFSFKEIIQIPTFYRQVLHAYGECQDNKSINQMKDYEILQETIWGNNLFKINNKPIFFKSWIESRIIYVKDLIFNNTFINIDEIYRKLINKQNWISEYYQISAAMLEIKNKLDLNEANYTNIPKNARMKMNNLKISINKQKSNFFYEHLRDKKAEAWYLKKKWERDFELSGINWNNFFITKIKCKEKKIANFNFKIINNILPGLTDLYVFGKSDTFECNFCQRNCDLKHILYDCRLSQDIWKFVFNISGLKVSYNDLLLDMMGMTPTLNF